MNDEKLNPFNGIGGCYVYNELGERIPEGTPPAAPPVVEEAAAE